AESDHFDNRREEHEEQRERIAQNRQEFFVQNGSETAKGSFHERTSRPLPAFWLPVSATKTSSSDAAMRRISALPIPALLSSTRSSSSERVLSTNKCMDCPNTVAVRTPGKCRRAWSPLVT